LGQLGGALSQRYDAWRGLLVQALAMLEAAVDFPDEELPEDVAARARPGLEALEAEIGAAWSTLRAADGCGTASASPWSARRTPARARC
jgi:tRNA U34 5-carboxymethylaminomethyl modifying GTPase MnmE/TrmE